MSITLDAMQLDIQARLNADEYFSDITVLNYREKDLVQELNKALGGLTTKAGKSGLFCFLTQWTADANNPDVGGPSFDTLSFNVVVVENVLINTAAAGGTLKPCMQAALRVAQVLHHYRPESLADTITVDRASIRSVGFPDDAAIAYQVPIRCPAYLDAPAKVEPVVMTGDGTVPLTVTMTCATSGAAIYYTTDESYPWSGNDEATLYDDPIALTEAATIRAVAHKTSMIASDSALGIYT